MYEMGQDFFGHTVWPKDLHFSIWIYYISITEVHIIHNMRNNKFTLIKFILSILREAAKKSSFFSGPATKRGEGVRPGL